MCQLKNKYNARHTASEIDRNENGTQKKIQVKKRHWFSHVTKGL